MSLCNLRLKKKNLSELDFMFSSYGHVNGTSIICKNPSSGQHVISLFFYKSFKIWVYFTIFSERDFNFDIEILLQ